jgi:hypothetical protein
LWWRQSGEAFAKASPVANLHGVHTSQTDPFLFQFIVRFFWRYYVIVSNGSQYIDTHVSAIPLPTKCSILSVAFHFKQVSYVGVASVIGLNNSHVKAQKLEWPLIAH